MSDKMDLGIGIRIVTQCDNSVSDIHKALGSADDAVFGIRTDKSALSVLKSKIALRDALVGQIDKYLDDFEVELMEYVK